MAMRSIGIKGYVERTRRILETARHIKASVQRLYPGDIDVVGNPLLHVLAFTSSKLNMFMIADSLEKKG